MSTYEQHEIGKCYPVLSSDDRTSFKDDIRLNGQLNPITLFDGKVLDGWHRYQICLELGIDPIVESREIKDPFAYVISQNEKRRQLTKGQLAAVGAEMATLKNGSNQFAKIGLVVTTNPQSAEARTSQETADQLGISKAGIDQVRTARRRGIPELVAAIKSGKIGTEKARMISALPKEEQLSALNKVVKKSATRTRKADADPKTLADNAEINASSLFPVDAPLPVHSSGDLNTKYIQEAILELRKNEPLLGQMSRARMNEDIWTYTQRIQTYGMKFENMGRVCGPIDQRFIVWAGEVANKVRAREAILDRHGKARQQRTGEPSVRAPLKGPAARLNKIQTELRKVSIRIRKIHVSQADIPELKRIFDRFTSDYFEGINPSSSNNGSKDPS